VGRGGEGPGRLDARKRVLGGGAGQGRVYVCRVTAVLLFVSCERQAGDGGYLVDGSMCVTEVCGTPIMGPVLAPCTHLLCGNARLLPPHPIQLRPQRRRYVVHEVLGSGFSGDVYAAQSRHPDLAVKVINTGRVEESMVSAVLLTLAWMGGSRTH
jgi:hypothetical protein